VCVLRNFSVLVADSEIKACASIFAENYKAWLAV
jgi:hypothetical protein